MNKRKVCNKNKALFKKNAWIKRPKKILSTYKYIIQLTTNYLQNSEAQYNNYYYGM